MENYTKYHSKHLLFFALLFMGVLFNLKNIHAQSALGQLEAITGQRVRDVRVPEFNGPTSEERAEWAAERKDARLAARRTQGIADNSLGNNEFLNKNYAAAISYYKKALRSLPDDEVIKNNLKTAQQHYDYYQRIDQNNKEFAKKKLPLLADFVQPAKFNDLRKDQVKTAHDSIITIKPTYDIGEGDLPKGQDPHVGGLSEAEWTKARECQKQLDLLSKKWPLTKEEIALYDANLYQRNALWARAILVPGMTGEERDRLRIKLYTKDVHVGEPTPFVLSDKTNNELTSKPFSFSSKGTSSEKIKPSNVTPIDLKLFGTYTADKGDALVEILATEHAENAFEGEGIGHIAGIGRIAIAYKKDGVSSALAATGDFLVGLIPIPQASMTIDAGRMYAGFAYQQQNKFMRQAYSITGKTFDEKQFWEDFDKDSGTGIKAVREWVGYGTK